MRAGLALLIAAAMLPGCADMAETGRAVPLADRAVPGEIVAAELAFARAAEQDGQWTAFRRFAAADALMFVPGAVDAQTWLRGRADPARTVRWQAHEVWMSCDGSLAVSSGAAQWPDGGNGNFLTVWQRQKDGDYRWVADLGGRVTDPAAEPEFVRTAVGACRPAPGGGAPARPGAVAAGASADGTLHYAVVPGDGERIVHLSLWNGTGFITIGPLTFAD